MRIILIILLCVLHTLIADAQSCASLVKEYDRFRDSSLSLVNEDYAASYKELRALEPKILECDSFQKLMVLRSDLLFYSFELSWLDTAFMIGYESLKYDFCTPKDSVSILLNLGNAYYRNGASDSAIYTYHLGLRVLERNNLDRNRIALLRGISSILIHEDRYDEAIIQLDKAIIEAKVADPNILAELYYVKGSLYQKQNEIDSATKYFSLGVKDATNDNYTALNYRGLAVVSLPDSAELALYYINEAEKVMPLSLNSFQSIHVQEMKARILLQQEKYLEAEEIINKVTPYYENEGKNNLLHAVQYYDMKSRINAALGRYDIAYESLKEKNVIADSVLTEEKTKAISEVKEKYDNDAKQAKIDQLEKSKKAADELAKAELEKEKAFFYIYIISSILLVAIMLILLKFYFSVKKRSSIIEETNKDLVVLNSKIENQKENLEKQSKSIKDSILYAKNIQNVIAPSKELLKSLFKDCLIFFKPRDEVSGDFIWYQENEKLLYLLVGDCTGHGVPGALISVVCLNIVEEVYESNSTIEPNKFLNEIGTRLNQKVDKYEAHESEISDGMDASLVRLNRETGELLFSGARNEILIIGNDRLEVVSADRRSIGKNTLVKQYDFSLYKAQLSDGDMVYMYTDGYMDQKGGPKSKKFYRRPFREMLQSVSALDAEQQLEKVSTTLNQWMENVEQYDDITVLGFRYDGGDINHKTS